MPLTKIDDRGLNTPIDLLDNEQIRLGTGNDLRIYHNGTHSYIEDAGAGRLNIATNQLNVTSSNSSETLINALENGAVKLYHDNSLKFETSTKGADITGGLLVDIVDPVINNNSVYNYKYGYITSTTSNNNGLTVRGNEASLEILASDQSYHAGSIVLRGGNEGFGFVNNSSDNRLEFVGFTASNNDFAIHNAGANLSNYDRFFIANKNGSIELYHDNSKKFQTGHGGEYGSFQALNGNNGWDGMAVGNSKFVFMGSNSDEAVGIWNDQDNEWMVKCIRNAETQLQYNGSKKFETTSGGAAVTGDLAISGEVNLTTGGNYNRFIDASLDNGEALFLRSTNGGDANHQNMAIFHRGGASELYHAAAKKFETTSYGNLSAGQVRVSASNASTVAFSCGDVGTGFYNSGSNAIGYSTNGTQKWNIGSAGHISLLDNIQLRLGTDADLQLSHSSIYNNSLIHNNTGDLYFRTGTAFHFQNTAGNENYATFVENQQCQFFYNNVKRIETTDYGSRTTGYHTQSSNVGFQGDNADWTSSVRYMHNMHLHWNSGHFVNSTGVFTCPVAGKYLCSASVQAHRANNPSGSNGQYYNVIWQKNNSNYHTEIVGTVATDASALNTSAVNGKHETITATVIIDCAANDTIRAYSNHGYRNNSQNICSVYLLG